MDISQKEIQSMKEIVDTCVRVPLFTYEMQQNAPRPEGEYAAVKCVSSFNPGFDEVRTVEINGEECIRYRGVRILTFVIVFSREGPEYIDYDNSFFRPDVLAKCKQEGFAALGKEALSLASIALETNWEVRHGIKMQFNVLREQISQTGIMSDAIVGGKFYDGNTVINTKGK